MKARRLFGLFNLTFEINTFALDAHYHCGSRSGYPGYHHRVHC